MSNPIAAAREMVTAAMKEEHRLFEKLQEAETKHNAAKDNVAMRIKKLEQLCSEQNINVGW